MKSQELHLHNRDDIVWNLVAIENDIAQLSVILQEQPLRQKEKIESLLEEIEAMAVKCRKKLLGLELKNNNTFSSKSVVSQKEIRELLEDFA